MKTGVLRAPLGLVFALFLLGCEEERPPIGQTCFGWKGTVDRLFQAECTACHGSLRREGGVSLETYSTSLDVVEAGNPASPVLTVFGSDETHRDLAFVRPTVETWVVDCRAQYPESGIHEAGILDPDSPDFHAQLLRETAYDFETCQSCHGESYDGGSAEASCLDCHAAGPTDCETCHARLDQSGAHASHLNRPVLASPVLCETCHPTPSDALEPGHFRIERGLIDPPPVEVRLIGPAAWGPPGAQAPQPVLQPSYEASGQRCINTYCHSLGSASDGATRPAPRWSETTALDCGSCHGDPPTDHPSDRCADCHPAVSPGRGVIASPDLHLDGRLQFGPDADGCGGCHGGMDGAPGPDLDGLVSRTETTVGAHAPHLFPRLRLSAPMDCQECHRVPAQVTDPGHIDSDRPAEVFGAGVGIVSTADGATPRWDRGRATCELVYCHGGGTGLSFDTSSSLVPTLTWTGFSTNQVFCGSCHGLPPTSGPHFERFTISDCVLCHRDSVDRFGNILFDEDGGTSHINGVPDFNPGGGN